MEGPKAVGEVLLAGPRPSVLIVCKGQEETLLSLRAGREIETRLAEPHLFRQLAATVTPQGVVALVPRPEPDVKTALLGPLVLVLDAIQDPGNVGALVRAAAAFGASGVLVGPGSAHPYGARAVRGSAGAVLRLPVVEADDWTGVLTSHGFRLAIAMARGGVDPTAVDWSGRWALVLGNEGHGSAAVGDRSVTLPLAAGVESLNVATAGAVLLYSMTRKPTGG